MAATGYQCAPINIACGRSPTRATSTGRHRVGCNSGDGRSTSGGLLAHGGWLIFPRWPGRCPLRPLTDPTRHITTFAPRREPVVTHAHRVIASRTCVGWPLGGRSPGGSRNNPDYLSQRNEWPPPKTDASFAGKTFLI